MALYLGSSIARGIFEYSAAEAAFHPWWQSLEDYALYSVVIVGNIFLSTICRLWQTLFIKIRQ
jgi:hypothetical protein